jgi:ankyrin repeat protein
VASAPVTTILDLKPSLYLQVRNLLLAGANVNEKTPQKLTALHLSAANGNALITSVLLDAGVDFNAVDNELNNALHVSAKAGKYQVCKVLLTESRIDAEAVNLKGQTPIHCLAK